MKRVTVNQAKTNLSKLLLLVTSGTHVEITRCGVPIAKLVPIESSRKKRVPGTYTGKIFMSSNFDSPLPTKLLKFFK